MCVHLDIRKTGNKIKKNSKNDFSKNSTCSVAFEGFMYKL